MATGSRGSVRGSLVAWAVKVKTPFRRARLLGSDPAASRLELLRRAPGSAGDSDDARAAADDARAAADDARAAADEVAECRSCPAC